MLHLFRLYQGGGMGVGHLPDAGGVMDQAAIMLDAFALMAGFEARLKDPDSPMLGEDGDVDHQEIGRRLLARFTGA